MPASNRIDPILWLSVLALCVIGVAVLWLATWDLPSAESTGGESDLSCSKGAAESTIVLGMVDPEMVDTRFTGPPRPL